jgi:ABC-type phosphate transport system substrate-binding protein
MKRAIAKFVGLALLLAGAPWLAAQTAPFHVVVHASNPVSALTRADLARIFLKKTSVWSDGKTVLPVDLGPESATRRGFSRRVLERDVASVKTYWQQMIFSGRAVPPPEKISEVDVLGFVRANSGAIGYVSVDTPLGEGLKLLTVKD